MFSSNQILSVSGSLKQLETALTFALNMDGRKDMWENIKETTAIFQITKDGRYCIGWATKDVIPEGWKEFQFRPNVRIIAEIIKQYIDYHFTVERDVWDGSYCKGFLMETIPETLDSEYDGIKKPFYCIVVFKPYTCFYSK